MGIKVGGNILWDLLELYLRLDLFPFRIYNYRVFCEF